MLCSPRYEGETLGLWHLMKVFKRPATSVIYQNSLYSGLDEFTTPYFLVKIHNPVVS